MLNRIIFHALLLITGALNAQKFGIGAGVGYGFPFLSQSFGANTKTISTTYPIHTESEPVRSSLGKGAQVYGSFLYSKNNIVAFDFKTAYHFGSNITTTSEIKTDYSSKSSPQQHVSEFSKNLRTLHKINQLQVIPSLKLSFRDSSINPYLKFGFVFGIVSRMTETFSYSNQHTSSWDSHPLPYMRDTSYLNTSETAYLYRGGFPVGITGGIGIEQKAYNKVYWFLECSFTGMNWSPRYREIIKMITNGEDKLSSMSMEQRVVQYTKPKNSSNTKIYFPHSNIVLSTGFRMAF